jgi:hypothetical protein
MVQFTQGERYEAELNRLEADRLKLKKQLRDIANYESRLKESLHKWMDANNVDRQGKYTKKSLTPKQPVKRKPKKEVQRETCEYLRNVYGIDDPRTFINDIDQFKVSQGRT